MCVFTCTCVYMCVGVHVRVHMSLCVPVCVCALVHVSTFVPSQRAGKHVRSMYSLGCTQQLLCALVHVSTFVPAQCAGNMKGNMKEACTRLGAHNNCCVHLWHLKGICSNWLLAMSGGGGGDGGPDHPLPVENSTA